jgi:hypothetical protein
MELRPKWLVLRLNARDEGGENTEKAASTANGFIRIPVGSLEAVRSRPAESR